MALSDGRSSRPIRAQIDGLESKHLGVDLETFASLALELGFYNAINVDGGGSTTVWVDGKGVINKVRCEAEDERREWRKRRALAPPLGPWVGLEFTFSVLVALRCAYFPRSRSAATRVRRATRPSTARWAGRAPASAA